MALLRMLILLILLSTALDLKAQSHYHFFTLGSEQGLSGDFTWSMAQDKYGFIWIGTTNGLNRYDGHSIRQYFNDPKDSFSIPANTIYWIQEDADGDMWFALGAKGLVKYNYEKDRFEKIPAYETIRSRSKFSAPVWRIYTDLQKRIYFACGGALFRYEKNKEAIEDLTPLFNGGIENDGVAMIVPQGKEKLWILTDGGLFFYDMVKNNIRQVPFDKEKYGFGLAAMHDGEFVNDEEMIISMGRPGFVLFNTKTWQFSLPPAPFDPSVTKNYSSTGGILKDAKGRIWLANSIYGLVEYFPPTRSSYSLKKDPSYPYPYLEQEGMGMNVFEDRDGNIWYGTSRRGVVWFQPQQDFITTYQRNYAETSSLADDAIHGFLPALNNDMYVATGKGLSKLNTQTGEFFNFPHSVTLAEKYPANAVRSFTAHEDTIIMPTDAGLSFYNQRTKEFSRITAKENKQHTYDLFTNNLARAHYDSPGQLILLAQKGTLARFDMQQKRCYYLDNTATDTLYKFQEASCTALDEQKRILWLEADEGKLFAYNLNTGKAVHYSYSNDSSIKTINSISVDKKGLWLATNKGLFFFNTASMQGNPVTLATATTNIFNVATKDGERIWLTTADEVAMLVVSTGKVVSFNLNALLPKVILYRRSLFVDKNNNAWVGGNKGFFTVDGNGFKPHTPIYKPNLVNVKVLDKQKLFDLSYADLKEIELDHNENFFSFEFSNFNFYQTAGIQFAHQLHPFDKDWIISDNNVASYTNVPPGTYKLLMRIQYGPGKWTEADPVFVHIHAPFWKRWWFIGIMLCAVLFALFLLYRYKQKRKTEKQIDATIDYFANSVYGENSVNEICWDIARNCIAQLQFEDCVVYLLDEEKNKLVQKAAYGPKNPKGHEIINPLEISPGEGIVGSVAASGRSLLVNDTTKEERYIVDDERRFSELAVPILHSGKVIGVIDSEHTQKNFFTAEHIKAINTIASISANKIAEATAESQAKENEIKLLEINKMLAESQLMALRAQMNPHFVFNCLNSIQECIVTQKYGEASKYLNKFSKLFRMVLNNSGKNLVTIDEEKEVLELYLELEQMRFEKSFTYKFDLDDELETEEILIPSMLLQPYVENALWHGLMHKEGERNLHISFQKINDEVFRCVIEDDGIGREKSFELKARQSKAKRHESKGLKISEDRINVLKRQGYTASLQIIDKYNETHSAAGTKVVIELSNFLKS
jgi:ligand-binding sensor domain-containing protein/putative methionine-R-sulfoxide reductase with GAF domain